MSYIDGFVLAVPAKNKEAYRQFSASMAPIFQRHGAIAVAENWGQDVPEGKINSMHTAVMCKPDETVVFSWIIWPSKAVRDEGMQRAMADAEREMPMPPDLFDGQRMIFGGFESLDLT